MATQGQVTKIYRLETVGYNDVHNQFLQLSKDLLAIKKLIVELQGQSIGLKGDDLAKVNAQIREALNLNDQLEQQVENLNGATDKSVSKYFELSKAYKQAKENAQDLAAEFGIESEQAKEAAASAAALKQQLTDINNLVKAGGVKQQAPVVPLAPVAQQQVESISNIPSVNADEITKTGDALSELERQEAETANAAVAMGESHLKAGEDIKSAGQDVSAITTKYEQYTGTIRQNIIAQLENNNQLIANRAAQKEIQVAINEQGSATEKQLNQLAKLKEEEQILIETNKSLTLTIRNQTKEFIASSGSLDEFQAQLNQLQQSYEQLTEVEKASPFGKAMKAEIDVLEPKVKSLEAELGKFQRNVGNYPTIFGGAFKVLENELDSVRGKLIQGNFSGKDLDELTAKEKVLTSATQTLGTSFATTTQEANAYKETGRQIATTFGTESQVFKNFSEQVGAGNAQLKATDQALNKASDTGGKLGGVFTKIFGGLRQIANVIPGLGISSLILLLITPFQALASSIFNVGKRATEAKGAIKDLAEQEKSLREALASTDYTNAVKNVNELRTEIDLAKKGFIDKTGVVDHYNETIGKTTGSVKDLNGAEKALNENADAYVKFTLLKAAANITLEKAAKEASEAAIQNQKDLSRISKIDTTDKDGIGEFIKSGEENLRVAEQEREQRRVKNLNDIAKDFLKQAGEISKNFNFNFFGDDKGGSKVTKDNKKSVDVLKDQLTLIDAFRDKQLADEQIKRLKNQEDEQTYLNNILKINTDAIDKKIALLKKGNADESKLTADIQRQIAQLNLEKVKDQQDTADKIFEINKKAILDQITQQKEALQQQVAGIELNRDQQLVDPNISETEKVNIKIAADQQIIALQQEHNKKVDELEQQLGAKSLQHARENAQATLRIQEQLLNDQRAIVDARLREIDKVAGTVDDKLRIAAAERVSQILDSGKSDLQKAREIQALREELSHDQLTVEVERLKQETDAYKDGVRDKLKTEKDYYDALALLKEKEATLEEQNVQRQLTAWGRFVNALKDLRDGFAANVLGIKQYANDAEGQAEKTADAVAQTERTVNQAITEAFNNYFTNKKAQIDIQTTTAEKQLDLEREQAVARAQSQAEIASIDKQYAVKKDQLDRTAAEKKKKLALQELAIDYAISVVKSLAQYGFPLALLPIAAETALYFVQRANIQKQQFAYGGKPGDVPLRGGKFRGQPHSKGGTDFDFKGKTYNAEVDELAIVRTRNAPKGKRYTITGTQSQIASAINKVGGGHDFEPGAKIDEQGNVFTNTVKRIFAFGGKLKEQNTITTSQDRHITRSKEDHLSTIIDRVMTDNKSLVETKNTSAIVSAVITSSSFEKKNITKENIHAISEIVNDKINTYHNKLYSVTGTTKQIYRSLGSAAKGKFAFGGIPGEVPINGGEFGGRPHSFGGTKFFFKGKQYEAEVGELAIIKRRYADASKTFTVTGNQMQIASFANKVGGGIDFKPGARVAKYAAGGFLGSSLQAPIFNPALGNSGNTDALLAEIKSMNEKLDQHAASNIAMAEATNNRIDNIKTFVVEKDITDTQNKAKKQTSIGTIS
jgi:hypothetical protein